MRIAVASRSFAGNAGAPCRAGGPLPATSPSASRPTMLDGEALVAVPARSRPRHRRPRADGRSGAGRRCRSCGSSASTASASTASTSRRSRGTRRQAGLDRRRQPALGGRADAGVCDRAVAPRARNERRPCARGGGTSWWAGNCTGPHGRHHRLRLRRQGSGVAAGAVWLPRAGARHSRLPDFYRDHGVDAGVAVAAARRVGDRDAARAAGSIDPRHDRRGGAGAHAAGSRS